MGVIIFAVITALCFKLIFGYKTENLTWSQALVLGAIIGTTDPASIIGMISEQGLKLRYFHTITYPYNYFRINSLIEGESLLNGGVALIFFEIYQIINQGHSLNIFEIIVIFVYRALGGAVIGLAIAILGSL